MVSLSKFDDNDIAKIEQLVQSEFKKWLSTKIVEADLTDFFGPIYYTNPEEFRFRCGDVKMLKGISDYIKSAVEMKGYNYFMTRENPSEPHHVPTDLSSQLFNAALKCLEPYGENITRRFQPYMVRVEVVGRQIKGSVHCILCDLPEYRQAKTRKDFYSQHWNGDKWSVINLKTHLNGHKPTTEEEDVTKDVTSTMTNSGIVSKSLAPNSDDLIEAQMELVECKVEMDPGFNSSMCVSESW